jgi:hypothetical protein
MAPNMFVALDSNNNKRSKNGHFRDAGVTRQELNETANTYNVTNSGSGAYVINGTSNPTLSVTAGQTYTFNINASGHPFLIKTNISTGTDNTYNTGVTNNGTDYGTITFVVPYNAPSTLYYNCQFHSSMAGTINVMSNPTPTPTPTPTPPISNICFPAGTHIKTDQGIISIELINKEKHTIHNKPIKHVSQTITLDKYLICFQPHSLGVNKPCQQTIMTKDHKIFYNDQLVAAHRFLNMSTNNNSIKKVQYNGELLYNILLAEHGLMEVNNLICETLSPKNIIAQLYNNNYSPYKKDSIICSMNESLLKKDYPAYKQLIERTFTEKKIEQNERFSMRKN